MTINIIQTTTKILDENRQLISSSINEKYALYPAPGKAIKDITTDKIYTGAISVSSKNKLENYIEIDL